jgi:hypothetical protein
MTPVSGEAKIAGYEKADMPGLRQAYQRLALFF